jgi:hypothetical protein
MPHETQLYVVASLLRRGKSLDNMSTGMLLLSLALGLTQLWITQTNLLLSIWVAVMVLTGVIAKFQALRVAFDADLFQRMADQPSRLKDLTQELDQTLSALGLLPVDNSNRPWDLRSQGALRQLRRQAVHVSLQLIWLLGIIFIFPWLSFAQ